MFRIRPKKVNEAEDTHFCTVTALCHMPLIYQANKSPR